MSEEKVENTQEFGEDETGSLGPVEDVVQHDRKSSDIKEISESSNGDINREQTEVEDDETCKESSQYQEIKETSDVISPTNVELSNSQTPQQTEVEENPKTEDLCQHPQRENDVLSKEEPSPIQEIEKPPTKEDTNTCQTVNPPEKTEDRAPKQLPQKEEKEAEHSKISKPISSEETDKNEKPPLVVLNEELPDENIPKLPPTVEEVVQQVEKQRTDKLEDK